MTKTFFDMTIYLLVTGHPTPFPFLTLPLKGREYEGGILLTSPPSRGRLGGGWGKKSLVSFNPGIKPQSGSGIILSFEGFRIVCHPLFHLLERDLLNLYQEPPRGLSGTMF